MQISATGSDREVRQPGTAFLNTLPAGQGVDFSGHEYWRKCLRDLNHSYRSVCAYTCHWIPLDTGADTVKHFLAKSTHPTLAYEWSNFRLVCNRLNGRKGKYTDVVDPFEITDGMFAINFPSLQVIPGPGANEKERKIVESSIKRLKLNDERCVRARLEYTEAFRDRNINITYLRQKAPFLAFEIDRQGLAGKLRQVMRPN